MRKRIKSWAWSPIVIPRSALVIKYLAFVYFGTMSIVSGVPIFNITAPDWYGGVWGLCMVVAGFSAMTGAIRERWETLEKWSVLVLSSLLLAYVGSLTAVAYATHDITRQAGAAGFTVALVLPIARFLYLARHGGKK